MRLILKGSMMQQLLDSKPDVQQLQHNQQQQKKHQNQQQPPHLQPYHLATVAPNGEQVHVSLSNAATWSKFSRQNTEMIVTKAGRRMFPCICLDISGLPPAKKYEVYVTLLPADQRTLKYQRGLWIANGQAEIYPPPGCTSGLAYVHPDSPASGRHWTKQEVTFMKLKLTNKLDGFDEPGRQGSMIFAYSMHKYLPVVHISELPQTAADSLEAGPHQPQDRFYTSVVFPGTEFITVTAYQNPELTDLKIQFNPYAKGVRNQTDRSTGLLIDTFRPTLQAMTQRQQQHQHQHQQQHQQPPAGVEFGSYPNQTVSAYGHWQQVGAGARRHQPYSLPASAAAASAVAPSVQIQHPPPHRSWDSPAAQATAAQAAPEPGSGDPDQDTNDNKNATASASATSSAAESADSAVSAAAAAAAAAAYYQSPYLYQPHQQQHHQVYYSPSPASSAAAAAYYYNQHQHVALPDYEQQQQQQQQQPRYYTLTPPHQEQQLSSAFQQPIGPAAAVGHHGSSEASLVTHQHHNQHHHHQATATPQHHLLASSSHVTDSSPSGVSFNSPDL